MTSRRIHTTNFASLVVVVACLISVTSCKRISPGSSVEQSVAPGGGSTTPRPCTVPFNGDFVNDSAGVMDADSRAKLEQKLDTLKSKGNIDFAVVTVKSTGEQPIADYSLALARCWDLGQTNPDKSGLLLLLAVDDRKWHMQISRSVEKILSNDEIQQAASFMTPELRNQNYAEGVDKCVDATIGTIAPRRKFSMQ